jgi:hypothetical protein
MAGQPQYVDMSRAFLCDGSKRSRDPISRALVVIAFVFESSANGANPGCIPHVLQLHMYGRPKNFEGIVQIAFRLAKEGRNIIMWTTFL